MTYGIEHTGARQELAFASGPALALNAPVDEEEFTFFGEDGFTFDDAIDIVNPLQHLPVISMFYRDATDDTIAAAPRVMGATLYFGPIGLIGALANVAVEESTGKDIGEHIADLIRSDDDVQPEDDTALAGLELKQSQADGKSQPEPSDPVLAWAQREAAWSTRPAPAAKPKAPAYPVPDADQFLQEDGGSLASAPLSASDVVMLTNDHRSAASAYKAAAGLA